MVVEFHTLNDMILEPDTDIAVRLQIARQRRRAATHIEAGHRPKLAREIGFVGRSASDPRPVESLSATREGQMYSVGLGLVRTYAYKPPFVSRRGSAALNANDEWH